MAVSNPGRNLDWKKVFKIILLKEEEQDNSMAEASDGSANFEPEVEKKELCSSEQEHGLSSKFSEIKNEQSISSINTSSESLSIEKNTLTIEPQLEFNSHISCSSSFYFKNKKTGKAPEWNKVFKEILGSKQSKDDISEKSNHLPQMQDGIKPLSQKQDAENKYGARRKPNCSSPGYKRDSDDAKVKELFASWTRVKPVSNEYNINDFDGAGINIFKDKGKKGDFCYPIRSHSGDLKSSNLSKYSDRPFEKDVPLTGIVAVNRCTKADIKNIRQTELTEVWDDDLLF